VLDAEFLSQTGLLLPWRYRNLMAS
jgi:hypothetical protein